MRVTPRAGAALQLDDVAADSLRALSCDEAPGQIARFQCAVQEPREQLWTLLTGSQPPRRGRVRMVGQDLYALSGPERLALFQRVGVVAQDGGLISNLKIWENIVLPIWYHRGTEASQVEARVIAVFREFGLDDSSIRGLMQRLPDQLSALERRWVACARAMLMEPDIMIYDAPFTGVEREAVARLLRVTVEFHRARADRVSVFLLPDEPISERVPADVTIALET